MRLPFLPLEELHSLIWDKPSMSRKTEEKYSGIHGAVHGSTD